MWLNCQVIKKWQPLPFLHQPPSLSNKIFRTPPFPPKWLNFRKVLRPLPLIRGGGVPTMTLQLCNIHRKTPVLKSKSSGLQLFEKEALTQVFSCEYYKFFKNTFFIVHFRWLLLNRVWCLSFYLLYIKPFIFLLLQKRQGKSYRQAWIKHFLFEFAIDDIRFKR